MLTWLATASGTANVALRSSCAFRLGGKAKSLQVAERELEQQRKQHHVAMDKLLLQIQGLEQALQRERHVVTEERWVGSGGGAMWDTLVFSHVGSWDHQIAS